MTEQRCTLAGVATGVQSTCAGKAVRQFTWVTSNGGMQGGPMCEACMQSVWKTLERYPSARKTVTISPLGGVAA
jgi:hypothetical protein